MQCLILYINIILTMILDRVIKMTKFIYKKDGNYTFAELKEAVKINKRQTWYKGYLCKKHNQSEFVCDECNYFFRVELPWTLKESVAEVRHRLELKINLTGYNERPQEEWTY